MASERYCARITATNSAGATTSSVVAFNTPAQPPSEVETAFAAPRTDTSALLNGRVNPQGETLTYSFQYSADGGETWTALAPQANTGEAREQVIVGEQLENLTPGIRTATA